jgi:4a-hydroxytetrahydrobiopterin dehydratase
MEWKNEKNRLKKTFTFNDFGEAFGFMTRVALLAEKMNHHPTWTNSWNTVSFELSTHDAGDVVTEKDRTLAEAIDRLAAPLATN